LLLYDGTEDLKKRTGTVGTQCKQTERWQHQSACTSWCWKNGDVSNLLLMSFNRDSNLSQTDCRTPNRLSNVHATCIVAHTCTGLRVRKFIL